MTNPSPAAMDLVGRLPGDKGGGAVAMAICNAVVGAFKRSCGKGPTNAKAYPLDDHVAVVIDNTLTTLEQTLVRRGHHDLVYQARHVLAEEVAEACRTPIEEATGRRVVGWMSQVDPDADQAVALIRLEPVDGDRPTPSDGLPADRRNGRGTAGPS